MSRPPTPPMRAIAAVVAEAAVVCVLAGVVALAANALSPRGLQLGRDYFPVAAATPMALATHRMRRRLTTSKRPIIALPLRNKRSAGNG